MSRFSIAALAALGLLVCPAAAQAAPVLYDAAKSICVKSGADRTAAVAAAGPGWTLTADSATSQDLLKSFSTATNVQIYGRRSGTAKDPDLIMLLADLKNDGSMPACMMVSPNPDPESEAALAAWVGSTPPMQSDGAVRAYLALITASGVEPVAHEDPRVTGAFLSGTIALLATGTRGKALMIGYVLLNKPAK